MVMAIDIQYGARILRIISTYLPHAGCSWKEFEHETENITMLTMEAKDQGKYVVIGGDFNLSLNMGDRGIAMQNLCSQCQLQIVNSEGRADGVDNWTYHSRQGSYRRIDYILVSAGMLCKSAYATSILDLGSDHRAVKAIIEFMRPQHLRVKRKSTYGWQPK